MPAETTVPKQRGRPFQKGHSGNPQGRPPGARNAATIMAEQLLDGEAETITRKVIELAKQGDSTALRLCLERIVPPRRERPVKFTLPEINSVDRAPKAMAAITAAVPRVIEGYVKAIETTEIERRLRLLEEKATLDAK